MILSLNKVCIKVGWWHNVRSASPSREVKKKTHVHLLPVGLKREVGVSLNHGLLFKIE